MEKCTCGGSGYIMRDGKRVPCICKILKIYDTYLKPFKKIKPPSEGVKNYVNQLLIAHTSKENKLWEKRKESLGTGGSNVERVRLPKHWFMIDPLPGDTCSGLASRSLGIPGTFFMQFFFQYLTKTKEYMSYRMFDLITLQNIYYGHGDGADSLSSDIVKNEPGFYEYTCGTFLLHFKDILPGKEAFNILRHFIDMYKEKNIIIYAEPAFRQIPKIKKWAPEKNQYIEAQIFGEKTLQGLLSEEYSSFIDLTL